MIQQIRKRTEPKDILYSLHLYFNGLSLRNTSKAISQFVTISHIAIRNWIQKFKPERLFHSKTKISKFIVDETQIKVDSEHIWLWVAIESETKNLPMRKALLKELCNTSKIGPKNVLMIIFRAERRNVN
jgi:putative transposase